jgi:hypothetical protein
MPTLSITDNVTGTNHIKVPVTNKDYKTMRYLETCGGFLHFNMEIYSDELVKKTETETLIPFLHTVFGNKELINNYFAAPKVIFKSDVSKIRNISNGLRMHQKANGTQVILSEANRNKIDNITALLSEAAKMLETIS